MISVLKDFFILLGLIIGSTIGCVLLAVGVVALLSKAGIL